MKILEKAQQVEAEEENQLQFQEFKEVKDFYFDESEITALDLPEDD